MKSYKVWIILTCVPFVALGPDIIYIMYRKIFVPNPSDKIIKKEKREAKYRQGATSKVIHVRWN